MFTTPAASLADIAGWETEFGRLHEQLRPHVVRTRTHERMKLYLEGILGKAERRNGWQLAEAAGDDSPYAMQHLIGRASWDVEGVRELTRGYVAAGLGPKMRAKIIDETGFVKKGTKSAGVARQYSGTAGRIENCQVGVFLAYATDRGCACVEGQLYLPEEWTKDRARCKAAGIPEETLFQTKPQIAQRMLERSQKASGRAEWVLGDEVYGKSAELRRSLEAQGQGYVLAVPCNLNVRLAGQAASQACRVDEITAGFAPDAWQCLSAGAGSKGPRLYDWAWAEAHSADLPAGWKRFLLARRNLKKPEDVAYYLVFAPEATTLAQMAEAAGLRWSVESAFEQAKQEVGLDEYEVRQWDAWNRYITLALLAHAFLVVQRARANAEKGAAMMPKHRRQKHPRARLGQIRNSLL